MRKIDKILEQQDKIEEKNEVHTLLYKISSVYIILGFITLVIGVISLISMFTKLSSPSDDVVIWTFINLGCGLFCLFAGCTGKAIDEIRNNIKK